MLRALTLTCIWKEPDKKSWVLIINHDSAFFKKAGITIGVPKNVRKDKEAEKFLVEFPDNHKIMAFGHSELVFF